jgi:hypothetical protein
MELGVTRTRTHTHAFTHTHSHTHARARAPTHTHTRARAPVQALMVSKRYDHHADVAHPSDITLNYAIGSVVRYWLARSVPAYLHKVLYRCPKKRRMYVKVGESAHTHRPIAMRTHMGGGRVVCLHACVHLSPHVYVACLRHFHTSS